MTERTDMSIPITLLQDANGDLWYNDFRINRIRFDEGTRIGYVYGTNSTKNSTILVSISAKPIIKPMTNQRASQPRA